MAVTYLFVDVLSLDLHQPGVYGKGDEVVSERAGIALGVVNAQGQRHGGGNGVRAPVHGTGTVYDDEGVSIAGEVLLRFPCGVDCQPLLRGDGAVIEEGPDDFVGSQSAGVKLFRAFGDFAHESAVAFAVISHESLAVLEHGLGGLFGVIKSVVPFPQIVFEDADSGAQGAEGFAVLGVVHVHSPGDALGGSDRVFAGGVDRGQPLAQQGDGTAVLQSGAVVHQLRFDFRQGFLLAGSSHQDQEVVEAAILRNVRNALLQGLRLVFRQPFENCPKDAALADAASDIPGVEQNLHGKVRVFGISAEEPAGDFLAALSAQRADGGEEVQALGLGGPICNRAVFSVSQVCFPL